MKKCLTKIKMNFEIPHEMEPMGIDKTEKWNFMASVCTLGNLFPLR